ncbi:hypothetical protein M5689_009611 [Euphorbia peplus]|nr:hypothetical protein M5689_009611 [Euphorbia peplus]
MDSISMSSAAKYFCVFLCIFMIISAGKINADESTQRTLLYQGPCANYPDCNKHCRDTYGTQITGLCQKSGNENVCFCIV